MIDLSMTKEQAVAVLLLINREQALYSRDPSVVPLRVTYLRDLMETIDQKLDDLVSEDDQ